MIGVLNSLGHGHSQDVGLPRLLAHEGVLLGQALYFLDLFLLLHHADTPSPTILSLCIPHLHIPTCILVHMDGHALINDGLPYELTMQMGSWSMM